MFDVHASISATNGYLYMISIWAVITYAADGYYPVDQLTPTTIIGENFKRLTLDRN